MAASVQIRSTSSNFGEVRAGFGRSEAEFGATLTTFGTSSTEVGQMTPGADFGPTERWRTRPTSGRSRPSVTRRIGRVQSGIDFGPIVAEFNRSNNVDRIWFKFGRCWIDLGANTWAKVWFGLGRHVIAFGPSRSAASAATDLRTDRRTHRLTDRPAPGPTDRSTGAEFGPGAACRSPRGCGRLTLTSEPCGRVARNTIVWLDSRRNHRGPEHREEYRGHEEIRVHRDL